MNIKKSILLALICATVSCGVIHADFLEELSNTAKRLRKTVDNVFGKENVDKVGKKVGETAKKEIVKVPGKVKEKLFNKKENGTETETDGGAAAMEPESSGNAASAY